MSESFVKLQSEQIKLTKEKSQIELSVQSYLLEGDTNNKEIADMILTQVGQANTNISTIENISEDFSGKSMNNILQDAYQPYFEDSEAFLQQATVMSEYIDQGNLRAARETNSILEELSEVMTASENQFQSVLDERIEHENSLIKSRVTRSIIIVWSMATLFIMSAAAGFWTFIKTIITPLKKANNSLGDIIEKLEDNEGDLTACIDGNSEDEVGQIIKGINRFLETLQHAMVSIKLGSNRINKTTENINNQMIDSKEATIHISSSLHELSAGMEEISSTIISIDEGAQEVLSSANDIADDANSNSIEATHNQEIVNDIGCN